MLHNTQSKLRPETRHEDQLYRYENNNKIKHTSTSQQVTNSQRPSSHHSGRPPQTPPVLPAGCWECFLWCVYDLFVLCWCVFWLWKRNTDGEDGASVCDDAGPGPDCIFSRETQGEARRCWITQHGHTPLLADASLSSYPGSQHQDALQFTCLLTSASKIPSFLRIYEDVM